MGRKESNQTNKQNTYVISWLICSLQHLKQSCIFGAIVGGYNERERLRCVKETIEKPVDGEQIGALTLD